MYYYQVKLWSEDEELASECNCPVGQDGAFCKQCVAVGLAWLGRRRQKDGTKGRQTKRYVTDEEIRAHLMVQDKSSLVKALMHQAEWDSGFRDRLVLASAQRSGKTPHLAAFRAAIDKANLAHGVHCYCEELVPKSSLAFVLR